MLQHATNIALEVKKGRLKYLKLFLALHFRLKICAKISSLNSSDCNFAKQISYEILEGVLDSISLKYFQRKLRHSTKKYCMKRYKLQTT